MRRCFFQRWIAVLVFFLNMMTAVSAQQGNSVPSFNVSYMANRSNAEDLQKLVFQWCQEALAAQGVNIAESPDWLLLLNAVEVADRIIISATQLQALPPRVVDYCVDHEVFYLANEKRDEFPTTADGKKIRQYVTSSFLEGYRCVFDNSLYVTNRTEMRATCREIIDGFVKGER